MQLFQQSSYALGSDILLTIGAESANQADPHFDTLWDMIQRFEQRFSRFRPESELTLFNYAAGKETEASAAFRKLLKAAKELSQATDGVYNPLILSAVQQAGYKGSWPHPERTIGGTDFTSASIGAAEDIIIGDTWAKIPKHTALDFGGIGKGYLLDQLAHYLLQADIHNFWLSLGGDIICSGNGQDGKPWEIAIQDAHNPAKTFSTIRAYANRPTAIATSGTVKRRGATWHHLIDPRTGKPAKTDILTATVVVDHAVQADIYAKCVVILGSNAYQQFCKKQHITDVIIQQSKTTK